MSNLMEMVTQQLLTPEVIGQLSQRIGASKEPTAAALEGAIPTLLGGMARNAESPEGAESLAGALERDHDGGILNDIVGFVSGAGGDFGILSHVLGGKQGGVVGSIAKMSGLEPSQVSQLLALAAPLVMGMLGRQKREQGLDASALGSELSSTRQSMESSQPDAMKLVSGMLDQDGDGSIADDVASLGSSLLGGLFGGK